MKLILLGAPGAGKGTMAEKIVAKYKMVHFSTGDIFRSEVKSQSRIGQKIKSIMDAGSLVPDELTIELINQKIDQEKNNDIILDGYPRTMQQAEELLSHNDDCKALYLKIATAEVVTRLSGRRTCPGCSAIYHIEYNPPKTSGKCDQCGNELIQRSDDSEASIRHRLEVYEEKTATLITYFENQNMLITIDASKSQNEVFAEISEKLEKLM